MNGLFRKLGMMAAIALLGVYAVIALSGPQGMPALMQKRAEIVRLQEQNADLQRENERKRERIRILEEQPDQQELEVRKQLNLGKPGETIFFLPDDKKK